MGPGGSPGQKALPSTYPQIRRVSAAAPRPPLIKIKARTGARSHIAEGPVEKESAAVAMRERQWDEHPSLPLLYTPPGEKTSDKPVTINLSAHMYVIKDLVPDMTNFYDQYRSIKPWLQTKSEHDLTSEHLQSQVDRKKLDGMYASAFVCRPFHVLSLVLVEGPLVFGRRRCEHAGVSVDSRQSRDDMRRRREAWTTRSNCTVPHDHEL